MEFLGQLAKSLELFLPGHKVELMVFSDRDVDVGTVYPVEHKPFPYPTLYRYRMMRGAMRRLRQSDYVYYMDVDSRVVGVVGDEILADRVAVVHEGQEDWPRSLMTFDTNPASRAYVKANEGTTYCAGGFQGGAARVYCDDVEQLGDAIDEDERNGVMAVWHDESHWNRYLIDHPHVTLPSCYMSAEWRHRPDAKILALDKNHKEMRCTLKA